MFDVFREAVIDKEFRFLAAQALLPLKHSDQDNWLCTYNNINMMTPIFLKWFRAILKSYGALPAIFASMKEPIILLKKKYFSKTNSFANTSEKRLSDFINQASVYNVQSENCLRIKEK